MNYNIALLKGDGIGPEIVDSAVAVLQKIGEKFHHTFTCTPYLIGGCAIDATGVPLMGQYDGQMQIKTVSRRVIEEYDFSELKHLYFSSRVDVGAGNTYSQAAMMQTLDNLRREGVIEFIDYLERVPDSVVPRRQELIQKLKGEAARMNSGVPAGAAIPSDGMNGATNAQVHSILQQMNPDKVNSRKKPGEAAPTVDDVLNEMPVNVREQFDTLPARAKGEVAKVAAARMQR